jgi:Family of unknown function (DUF6011)
MSANSITPAQLRFVRSLLVEREAVLQIPDVDAFMEAQSFRTISVKDASRLIDKLRSLPRFAQPSAPEPAAPSDRRGPANRFAAPCHECGRNVPAQAGWREQVSGRWLVHHQPGECVATPKPADKVLPELDFGLYFQPSLGRVLKVYKTQNDRKGVMTTVEGHKGLHYMNGGLRVATAAQADGDLVPMTQEQAAAFGSTHSFCCACGKDLDDDRSIAAGYGPVCAGKYGWSYPSYEQAEAVLGRAIPRKGKKTVEVA